MFFAGGFALGSPAPEKRGNDPETVATEQRPRAEVVAERGVQQDEQASPQRNNGELETDRAQKRRASASEQTPTTSSDVGTNPRKEERNRADPPRGHSRTTREYDPRASLSLAQRDEARQEEDARREEERKQARSPPRKRQTDRKGSPKRTGGRRKSSRERSDSRASREKDRKRRREDSRSRSSSPVIRDVNAAHSCRYCGVFSAEWKCRRCGGPDYCNEECEKLDTIGHKDECDAIRKSKGPPKIERTRQWREEHHEPPVPFLKSTGQRESTSKRCYCGRPPSDVVCPVGCGFLFCCTTCIGRFDKEHLKKCMDRRAKQCIGCKGPARARKLPVRCPFCKLNYCKTSCKENNSKAHGLVCEVRKRLESECERCQGTGPDKLCTCGKLHREMVRCASCTKKGHFGGCVCGAISYCGTTCQWLHREAHIKTCASASIMRAIFDRESAK